MEEPAICHESWVFLHAPVNKIENVFCCSFILSLSNPGMHIRRFHSLRMNTITAMFLLYPQCDENCSCTSWENDGICTKTCGTGAQRQKRTCGTPPNSGTGTGCDVEAQDIACNTQEVSLDMFILMIYYYHRYNWWQL